MRNYNYSIVITQKRTAIAVLNYALSITNYALFYWSSLKCTGIPFRYSISGSPWIRGRK